MSTSVKLPKSQFSMSLPGPQFAKLTTMAKQHGLSRSSYAADVLAKHLSDLKGKAA
jgi:hypothetical protein